MEMRVENWCGYDIRFVNIDGEWWAILKDVCDALGLKTFKVSQRLDPDYIVRVPVEATTYIPSKYNTKDDIPLRYIINSNEFSKTVYMLAINETGVYEALFASKRLEARKFRRWAGGIMQKLRRHVGLEGYEVMRMTEPEIQDEIDYILDGLFYDPETKQLMYSVTVAGGDVDQVPFDEYIEKRGRAWAPVSRSVR